MLERSAGNAASSNVLCLNQGRAPCGGHHGARDAHRRAERSLPKGSASAAGLADEGYLVPAGERAVGQERAGVLRGDADALQLRRDVAPLLLQRPGQLLKLRLLLLHGGQDAGGRLHLRVVHGGEGRAREGGPLREGRREEAPHCTLPGRRERRQGHRSERHARLTRSQRGPSRSACSAEREPPPSLGPPPAPAQAGSSAHDPL